MRKNSQDLVCYQLSFITFSIVNYHYYVINYIPGTYFSYNWKFAPFDYLHLILSPSHKNMFTFVRNCLTVFQSSCTTFFFFFFWTLPRILWALSSLTKDQEHRVLTTGRTSKEFPPFCISISSTSCYCSTVPSAFVVVSVLDFAHHPNRCIMVYYFNFRIPTDMMWNIFFIYL